MAGVYNERFYCEAGVALVIPSVGRYLFATTEAGTAQDGSLTVQCYDTETFAPVKFNAYMDTALQPWSVLDGYLCIPVVPSKLTVAPSSNCRIEVMVTT